MRAIVAIDDAWGIGKDGSMPWPHNSIDMAWFKDMTIGSTVVMGRGTWEARGMPKPLPNRTNVVISSSRINDHSLADVVLTYDQFMESKYLNRYNWFIGGAELINSSRRLIDELFLTRIPGVFDCDTFIDKDAILAEFNLAYTIQINDQLAVEKYIKK
jgi:dihydrofolate reductase